LSRSVHGGRHELGQNFLHHSPTIDRIVRLVRETDGPILEIGAGAGALTEHLATLGRDVLAVDIDEHRVRRLRRRLPSVAVVHDDALRTPLDRPVVVGNLPFHLTTPILRRLLADGGWAEAILLTQWEVARKRAGVGGRTMLTAQTVPWRATLKAAGIPPSALPRDLTPRQWAAVWNR
jgi:23S rRNA (adenine-N6)-dimethyltransferase